MSDLGYLPRLRIVNTNGNPHSTDVFNADTGEKILNVARVSLDISRGVLDVKVTVARSGFEYEGPGEIVEESDDDDAR